MSDQAPNEDEPVRFVDVAPFLYRGHHIQPTAPRRNLFPLWEECCWLLVTCLDGTLTLESPPRRVVLRPGFSALAEPGHHLEPGKRARGTLINFDLLPRTGRRWHRGQVYPVRGTGEGSRQSWRAAFGDDHLLLIPESARAGARQLTGRLANTRTNGGPDHLVANLALAGWIVEHARLLGQLPEIGPETGEGAGAAEPGDGDDFAIQVERKIWSSLSDGLTALDLAAHYGIDRSTLERRYRAHRGRSVHAAIEEERSRRAQDLLRNHDKHKSMAVIAAMVGFSSAAAFSTWFRRRHGMTPSGWRLRQRL